MEQRIGWGYDIHRSIEGDGFRLGGVDIPASFALDAHSDGDVLIHSSIDALFGALALGDIGSHFPDDDPQYKDADSRELLQRSFDLVRNEGYELGNLDATIIAEAPKLNPHIDSIRSELAELLGVEKGKVSVKATTHEGLGPIGAGEGIAAQVVVLLYRHR